MDMTMSISPNYKGKASLLYYENGKWTELYKIPSGSIVGNEYTFNINRFGAYNVDQILPSTIKKTTIVGGNTEDEVAKKSPNKNSICYSP